MSRYIDEGWNFLSDDSCIIQSDGTAYLHPLPIHIYKYHEHESANLVKKMLTNFCILEKFLWSLLSLIKKPNKLVRWVDADKVFGKEKISKCSKIATVIHMHRHMRSGAFELKRMKSDEVARLMANTILDEINNLVNMSIVVHSCQPSNFIPDITHLHRGIINIYCKAFANAGCYSITIPAEATANDTYSFIHDNKLF